MSKKAYPQEIAEEIISAEDYLQNLIYLNEYECFFLWSKAFPEGEGGYYIKLDEKDLKRRILKFCEARFPNQAYSDSTLKDIANLMRLKVLREYPCEQGNYISFKDKLFNMNTFETEEFDRKKIAIHFIPYNFNETNNKTEVWERFLNSSLVHAHDHKKTDDSLVRVVQEMFGMFLLDNLKSSSAFFLYGKSGANGKSQMTQVIMNVFGREQCTALSLNDFNNKFALVDLIGSKVNIASELDEKFGNSRVFKGLVSGDPIRAEYKFGGGVMFIPRTKFIFSTNRLPTFDGLDGGMRRRVKIIPFYRQFKDTDPDKDYNLADKLKLETAGIVGWAIRGAKRLVENNYRLSRSTAVRNTMTEFDSEMSGAIMFINEENYAVDNGFIPTTELYQDYMVWSAEVNKRPMSRHRFYEDIEGIVEGIKKERRTIENKQVWCYNIQKRADWEIDVLNADKMF